MSSRLANTIFQGRSTEAMLVVDAYEVSDSAPRNTVYESAKGIYNGAVKTLTTDKDSVQKLATLVRDYQTGYVDKTSMMTRALGIMGSSLPSLLGGLAGGLKDKITAYAGTGISDNLSKAYDVVSKAGSTYINSSNYGETYALTQIVSELMGDPDLLDFINVEAETSILAGIANELIAYGIPGMVGEMINQNQSERVRYGAWSYVSESAINYSNLDYLNQSIDYIGWSGVLERIPDAVIRIPEQFVFPPSIKPEQYDNQLTELVNTIARIDPHWDEEIRDGKWVKSLKPYATASDDAKTLFSKREPYRSLFLAAQGVEDKRVKDVMLELYPNAFIS